MTIFGKRQAALDDNAAKLGYVTVLLSEKSSVSHLINSSRLQALQLAISYGQVEIYFSTSGNAIAFLTWALLTPEVEDRICREARFSIDVSEWNEGNSLWIVDFCAPRGDAPAILCDLRDRLFRDQASVRYMRIRKNMVIVKQVDRCSPVSFFKRGTLPMLSGPTKLPGWD